jgi:hypothetical protein
VKFKAKQSIRLKKKHGWKARPGHSICAIDRGAIRFDIPQEWHVSINGIQVDVRDRPEPDDNCLLAVSRIQMELDLADQIPITDMVRAAASHDDEREIVARGEVVVIPREDGIEMGYTDLRHFDRKQNREAIWRLVIARGSGVYCMMTFDVWVDETAKYDAVWEEALRSLTLGVYVQDPTVGPVTH